MSEKDGVKSIHLALYFLGAVVSGGGGTYAWLVTNGAETVAPDRFTGTQASALVERVVVIEDQLINHKLTHPDRALELRVSLLESNYTHITETLNRIEKKLDDD